MQILYGNLASGGSVAKISGKEGEQFTGTARVFNGEQHFIEGIETGRLHAGDVAVIKNIGPVGAPGMPEMLKPTSALIGAGLGKSVALITDGRFSGGTHEQGEGAVRRTGGPNQDTLKSVWMTCG